MNLQQTINTNLLIMALIKSKYPDISFLNYNTPDARYYRKLARDNFIAESALKHNGIAEIKRG